MEFDLSDRIWSTDMQQGGRVTIQCAPWLGVQSTSRPVRKSSYA